ncbi:MAG: site-specific recombinase XerD [Sulfitobacter sp.]
MSINKKTNLTNVEKGLAIYKTGRSRFWTARFWDRRLNKHVTKSTGEVTKIEARSAAREWKDSYLAKTNDFRAYAKTDDAFEYYAQMVPKRDKDDWTLLSRKEDGILALLGNYKVEAITTAVIRDYLNQLNANRSKPLAVSTQKKHIITIRKALRYARENGKISQIPEAPKLAKMMENPRPSFTDDEADKMFIIVRNLIDKQAVVQGHMITSEVYAMLAWMIHTFVRPTQNELFNIKVSDCRVIREPYHVEMKIHGKTGYRVSASMPEAAIILSEEIERRGLGQDDYLWFSEYENRHWAMRKAGLIFNKVLDRAGLRFTQDGQKRSLYSMRHYAIGRRLRTSEGKVNIYSLAKNAGTSVAMLERFYLRNLPSSPELVKNLQSGSQVAPWDDVDPDGSMWDEMHGGDKP